MKATIGGRRFSREWALQFLFQSEFNQDATLDDTLRLFWENQDEEITGTVQSKYEPDETNPDREKRIRLEARQFAEELIRGVLLHHVEIDELIRRHAKYWAVERLGTVERNAIRIAVFELLYLRRIPPAVSINEAIDLAKIFSSRESGKFVNGVLDNIHRQIVEEGLPTDAAKKGKA